MALIESTFFYGECFTDFLLNLLIFTNLMALVFLPDKFCVSRGVGRNSDVRDYDFSTDNSLSS